jgi:3-oxoadipate enol-lactonase
VSDAGKDAVVTVADIDIAYTAAGSGAPVVLVHGLAGDRISWSAQLGSLDGFRTVAYDLRGHGSTTLGNAEGTLAQLGGDLLGFLEHVTGPATVVGFSLGGTVALWAAAQRSELVTHAVVLGTSSVVGRAAANYYADRIAKAANTSSEEFRSALRDDTAAAIATATHRLDDVVAARLRAVGDGRGFVNAARAIANLRPQPLTPLLAGVKIHVDVIGASADTFCPAKAAAIIVDALADSSYQEIDGTGHLMNVDDPNAVTEAVRAALAGRS